MEEAQNTTHKNETKAKTFICSKINDLYILLL